MGFAVPYLVHISEMPDELLVSQQKSEIQV